MNSSCSSLTKGFQSYCSHLTFALWFWVTPVAVSLTEPVLWTLQLCSVGAVVLNPVANEDVVRVTVFIGDAAISDVHWLITLVYSHWMVLNTINVYLGIFSFCKPKLCNSANWIKNPWKHTEEPASSGLLMLLAVTLIFMLLLCGDDWLIKF